MNASYEIPVISSDAGDPVALRDPNSPASIMKKAKEQETQSAADMKFDAQAPPRVEGFDSEPLTYHETIHSLLLASSIVLLLYAAAPN